MFDARATAAAASHDFDFDFARIQRKLSAHGIARALRLAAVPGALDVALEALPAGTRGVVVEYWRAAWSSGESHADVNVMMAIALVFFGG